MNQHQTSYKALFLITFLAFAPVFYAMLGARESSAIYDTVMHQNSNQPVKKAEIGDKELIVPDWSLFAPNHIWMLSSINHPLPDGYVASSIINTKVSHALDASRVNAIIESDLEKLVKAAGSDGIDLMLSSAYRSVADQQNIYDNFVETKGKAAADLYVAKPGTSEHHTGLAVDFGDSSSTCQSDSDSCNLTSESAEWLARNAYRYGFILRYPEGSKPITGIAYEPWHYRYVGKTLASALQNSDLTLDEALGQLYPAFTKR